VRVTAFVVLGLVGAQAGWSMPEIDEARLDIQPPTRHALQTQNEMPVKTKLWGCVPYTVPPVMVGGNFSRIATQERAQQIAMGSHVAGLFVANILAYAGATTAQILCNDRSPEDYTADHVTACNVLVDYGAVWIAAGLFSAASFLGCCTAACIERSKNNEQQYDEL